MTAQGTFNRFASLLVAVGLLPLSCWPAHPALPTDEVQTSASTAAKPFAGYDIISVKPAKPGSSGWRMSSRDTTFAGTNVPLKSLLMNAYGIREALIFGLPKWAETSRWDINAKVLEVPAKEEHLSREEDQARYRAKVQSILLDRFGLKAHIETKVLPTFELVVMAGPSRLASARGEEKDSSMNVHNQEMTGTSVPMNALTRFVADQVGRNVVDKTGLTGLYDITLKWSPDEVATAAEKADLGDRPPSIYNALQEQLGLKLVPAKGLSDTLVVDSIEEPAAD